MKTLKELSLILLIIGVAVLLLLCLKWVMPAEAEPLDTYHTGWNLVRETATEDGANFAAVYDLTSDEGNFDSKDSSSMLNGGPFHISTRASTNLGIGHSKGAKWQFVICGNIAENDTFSFNVVGWAKDNGMLQVICEGAGALGTQDVVTYPDGGAATGMFWVDTITLDETTKWPKQQGNLVGADVYNSGDNEVALLVVETMGLEWVQFVLYDCDGSGTEMGTPTVYGRPY